MVVLKPLFVGIFVDLKNIINKYFWYLKDDFGHVFFATIF
jgi:hypothetical protein